jgi:uncharacterized protein (TIGR02722 family)
MKNLALALPLALAALAGCSSVQYDDPQKVETVNIDFGSTDLQTLAQDMVQSLTESPALSMYDHPGKEGDKRVILYMGGVDNRTTEHIDTGGILDKMRVALLSSGKFRIATTQQGQDELAEQVRFQQGSGRVDPAQAKAFGRQIGADAVLYGTLRSIVKKRGSSLEDVQSTKDVYYQFVLETVDIETGEVIWANESEIRKVRRKGPFGS